jgi:hypothetical protein
MTAPTKLHNFRNSSNTRAKLTDDNLFRQYNASTAAPSTMINLIPAHAIILDFLLAVIAFLSTFCKVLIFTLSYCWQATTTMARTKTRVKGTNYTRVRTFNGATVTIKFVQTNAEPRTTKLRNLEKKVLRNLGTIQQFNISNNIGPNRPEYALTQRQRYLTTPHEKSIMDYFCLILTPHVHKRTMVSFLH